MSQPGLLVLIGSGMLLTGMIALELSSISADDGAMIASSPRPSPVPSDSAVASPAVAPSDGRQALVAGILARPLFAPGRRPTAAAVEAPALPVILPRLAGVLVSGLRRSAIFAAAEGGRPLVAEVGAQVGGYTVQAIEAGSVTLSGPSGTQVLRPSFDTQPPVAGATAPRMPAGIGAPAGAGVAPFGAPTDVMPLLRGLSGFSGTPAGNARVNTPGNARGNTPGNTLGSAR